MASLLRKIPTTLKDRLPFTKSSTTHANGNDPANHTSGSNTSANTTDNPSRILATVERSAKIQVKPIARYVELVKSKHRGENPAQVQKVIDKHFRRLATTTGIGAGASAAVPGVGTIASLGVSTGDAFLFLELTTWYTLSSAYLRGIDISRHDDRTALVLLAINGSSANEAIATVLGSGSVFRSP